MVNILKPENDGDLELVKNVSCNPNTYHLQSKLLEVGLEALQVPLDNGMLHHFGQVGSMKSPSRHQTGLNISWKGPDSAPPSSACLNLQVWVEPGVPPEGAESMGCTNPSTSTRTLPTLTAVGGLLDEDESPFEDVVFKGPPEPLGAVFKGPAEPLGPVLEGTTEQQNPWMPFWRDWLNS